MNKFIEYDIHNGITLIKCAVMNILDALDKMEIDSYEFGSYISPVLDGNIIYSPSKRDFVFNDNLTLELYNG